MSVRTAACCVALLCFCGVPSFGQGNVDAQPGVAQGLESGSPENLDQQPVAVPGPSMGASPTTVIAADANFKLILGGTLTADFLFNSARPVAPGTPFFLTPGLLGGFNQSTFDANARQSTLLGTIIGPEINGFQSGGQFALTLFNDSIVVDRYGLLPILAYGDLRNDDWRFAAGLQFDIFNPLNPTVLPFSLLSASGNAGAYRGQARIERFLYPAEDAQVTLTAGVSEPVPTILTPNLELTEDNGWPNVEGRVAVALGPLAGEGPLARRPFEWGVSGLVGQIRTTETTASRQVVADVWGLGSDLRWSITPRFGIQGELFVGQALGTYGGGILQSVNAVSKTGVRDSGGWGEVYYYLCPETLHTHIGYGIDDPLDRDLAPGQPVRNDTYFANLIWEVTKHFRLAGEVTYRRTAYTLVPNNDGIGFHTQVQWRF